MFHANVSLCRYSAQISSSSVKIIPDWSREEVERKGYSSVGAILVKKGFCYGGGIVKSSPTPPSQLTLQETQIQRNACKNFIKKNVNKKISSIRILLRFFFYF